MVFEIHVQVEPIAFDLTSFALATIIAVAAVFVAFVIYKEIYT